MDATGGAPSRTAGDGWRFDGEDLVLNLRVQPRATPEGFAEAVGDAIKLRIKAAPVEGRANERLIAVLAREFGVGRSRFVIESGLTGRNKRVRVRSPARLPASMRGD